MRFSLACFNGRRPQSEAKVPLRPIAPLVLKNYVSNKGSDMPGMIYMCIYMFFKIFYDNLIITYYFSR